MTSSQCQSATRNLAVGRLHDLGGFPNCLVPDSGVRVGEGSFGGVEPGHPWDICGTAISTTNSPATNSQAPSLLV